ncbi:unnamed protein product [Miscanthus lutarioriparius]|uniref:Gnk2-homologous domain-containing protein n=1 Tax=Miscanthus lutarioriparius TaxID=422564 RepID=A0A811RW64_9POAL|nr:unnamed protein product [Miscanthus lutarioriparius]
MALPAATVPFVVLLLLLVPTGGSGTGGSDQGGGGGCFAPLIGCAPPASATGNATAFRASLAPLLAALPSAAAAAAEGFAALRSQPDPGRDRAHALGLCFGFGFGFGGVADASDCHACLRAAVAAASEGCANDTRRAGVWSHGCLLAYYAGDVASSYTDGLEQTLADLTMALAQPKGPSLWRKAQSIMSFVLAAIGAVTVVVLACFLVGCYLLAETLFGNMAEAGPQGDGFALYIAATNGQAQVWSLATQF